MPLMMTFQKMIRAAAGRPMIAIALMSGLGSPAVADDLTYDPSVGADLQERQQLARMEGDVRICLNEAERALMEPSRPTSSALPGDLRDSKKIIGYAVSVCTTGKYPLFYYLVVVKHWSRDKAGDYVGQMAAQELDQIPGAKRKTPNQ
jgi:hypothetical protein